MDLNKLEKECDEIVVALSNEQPTSKEYTAGVNNLVKLAGVKNEKDKLLHEQELALRRMKLEEDEKRRRFELDQKEKLGRLTLDVEEKKRRFDLDKTEKNRRFESEKRLTDAEVAVKQAEIELNKRKFEADRAERDRRFELEKQEIADRLDIERIKLVNENDLASQKIKLDSETNQAIIQEKLASISAQQSVFRGSVLPVLEKVIPAAAGLAAAVITVRDEETRIVTSKASQMFKLPQK